MGSNVDARAIRSIDGAHLLRIHAVRRGTEVRLRDGDVEPLGGVHYEARAVGELEH
jgi:hypothetical protein